MERAVGRGDVDVEGIEHVQAKESGLIPAGGEFVGLHGRGLVKNDSSAGLDQRLDLDKTRVDLGDRPEQDQIEARRHRCDKVGRPGMVVQPVGK